MEKTDRPEGDMRWDQSGGGFNGPKLLLMIGKKYVGHFYVDASDGIDADDILKRIATLWNSQPVGDA